MPPNQDKSAHHHRRAAQAANNTMLIALLGASPQAVKGAEEAFGMRFRMVSSAPHSAGVRVKATTTESIIAEIMVTENWR